MATRPDFFLCGAPRAGTTALCRWLGAHPGIFMPAWKEPQHFAPDLRVCRAREVRIDAPEAYRALYAPASPGQLAGDGSTWHFLSREAPGRIHAHNPGARLLFVLRDPVDLVYSWHGLLREHDLEDLPFEDALAAEDDRRAGRRLPPRYAPREGLYYRELGRFAAVLERYHQHFPREQIHIEFFEDLRRDPAALYGRVLTFLGVADTRFQPEFTRENARSEPRSVHLRHALNEPPPWIRRPLHAMVPRGARAWLYGRLAAMNRGGVPRGRVSPKLRKALVAEWADDIRALEALAGRDLSSWRTG